VIAISALQAFLAARSQFRRHSRYPGLITAAVLILGLFRSVHRLFSTGHHLELDSTGNDNGCAFHRIHDSVNLLDNILRPLVMGQD
jgi:hypothetical protein